MKKRQFTLIELLVVIAIISILMTILLPALRNTKLSTLSINCISNIRQMGTALSMYGNDYNGYLPYYYEASSNTGWNQNLINNDYSPKPNYMKPHISVCPLQKPKVWIDNHCLQNPPIYVNGTTYGLRVSTSNIKLGKISNPSQYFLIGDSRMNTPSSDKHYQWYYVSAPSLSVSSSVHLRHFGKANILYGDFSVRSTKAPYFDEEGIPYIDQDYNP